MTHLAVLITCHNRKHKTLKCLELLSKQKNGNEFQLSIFLVDDGSTDGTSEAVKMQFPKVNIIQGDGNLFWNRGMNLAWQIASKTEDYDFYLWLNDDTTLYTNALSLLLQTSELLQHKSIVVGSTCDIDDSSIITYGGHTMTGQLIKPTNNTCLCHYFNGNIVLIPNYVYRENGKNDPFFNHALGDFDYGLRAKKIGINSYIAPNVFGTCNEHEVRLSTWCNPNQPFKKRWVAFRSPLGNNPEEHFIFEKRHAGLSNAVFHYITNHIRVLFPKIWR